MWFLKIVNFKICDFCIMWFLINVIFEKFEFWSIRFFKYVNFEKSIRILHFTSKINAVPLCCTAAQFHTAALWNSASNENFFKTIYFCSKVTLALNFKVKLIANSVWHWSSKIISSIFFSKKVRKKLLTFLSQNHDFWNWPIQKILEKCKSKSFSVSHQETIGSRVAFVASILE